MMNSRNTGSFYIYDDELLEELEDAIEEVNKLGEELGKEDVVNKDAAPPEPVEKSCSHEWETYMGLAETFDHCKLCGIKRVDYK